MSVDTAGPHSLRLDNVSKRFGGISALSHVSAAFRSGEIHAVCGENGAGKSTLVKVLGGLHAPDEGTMFVDDAPIVLRDSRAAQRRGIAVVAQELSICRELSVLDNIWLGSLQVPFLYRRSHFESRAAAALAQVGLSKDVLDIKAGTLRLGERQLVEIARALVRDARTLILDEPTATLSDAEIGRIFTVLRRLRADGKSIVYISHRLNEIFALCDAVTVLRNGQVVSSGPTARLTRDGLIGQMLGKSSTAMFPPVAGDALPAQGLTVRGLRVPGRVSRFDADVEGGRILCIAGQIGSGAEDAVAAIAGLVHEAEGDVAIGARKVALGSVAGALRSGIVFVSGDRARNGIFVDLSAKDNLVAAVLPLLTRFGILVPGRAKASARASARQAGVDVGRLNAPARQLSGGNQQKLAFARLLGRPATKVLVMNEPTRGIDVGARAEIYRLMRDFCRRGCALVVTSTDLEEIVGLGDEIVTMYRGAVVGRYRRDDIDVAGIVVDITHPDRGHATGAAA